MARIFDVIPAQAGIQKIIIISRPEFISGSTTRDAQNLFSMTKKSLDSHLRGNDIRSEKMTSKT
ncbi:hypothetical protein [Rickettsia endosymbiont of Orchestes rusci]|uniref:hypothetical protein n=1 Tax=Rickettsia endosymbiont of Orchestes rusci TaxID=3066250 RepID=UPI00313D2263